MKKLLRKFTGWMVKKTNYTPELPLPIQPIIITPESLKKFHAHHIVNYYELHINPMPIDWYITQFREEVMNAFINEIEIKTEETPDGIMYSADLLFRNI